MSKNKNGFCFAFWKKTPVEMMQNNKPLLIDLEKRRCIYSKGLNCWKPFLSSSNICFETQCSVLMFEMKNGSFPINDGATVSFNQLQ